MKKIMELMAEELSAAFEKAGYDPAYGRVTVSSRPDLCEYQCLSLIHISSRVPVNRSKKI